MRLGQLARKYNVSQDDVILYLNEVQTELSPFHHNSKLSEETEDLVTNRFYSPEETEEAEQATEEEIEDIVTEKNEVESDVVEIENAKEIEASLQLELDPTLPPIQISEPEPEPEPEPTKKEEIAIDTDSLLELLDSEEDSPDLSNITHIKASKKELSGLKVVGKIELAELKSKIVEESKKEEIESKPKDVDRQERQRLYDEEREKRRLKAKEKKEAYEARQGKRRIEEEKKQKKAQNKARYEQQMQQIKTNQPKPNPVIQDSSPEVDELPPKPTSFLGKFWAWLKA